MSDRQVSPHGDGWQVTKPGATRASEVLPTQAEAVKRAREIVRNSGGGELVIHGKDGKVREKVTVAPGNDPFPPAG